MHALPLPSLLVPISFLTLKSEFAIRRRQRSDAKQNFLALLESRFYTSCPIFHPSSRLSADEDGLRLVRVRSPKVGIAR